MSAFFAGWLTCQVLLMLFVAVLRIRRNRSQDYDDLLADIALYIDWRYVTKQLTTDQKEMFADAVERSLGHSAPYVDRWWRQ